MPATRDLRDKLVKCETQILNLIDRIDRLDEKTQRFITTKNLTILVIITTVLSVLIGWGLNKYL